MRRPSIDRILFHPLRNMTHEAQIEDERRKIEAKIVAEKCLTQEQIKSIPLAIKKILFCEDNLDTTKKALKSGLLTYDRIIHHFNPANDPNVISKLKDFLNDGYTPELIQAHFDGASFDDERFVDWLSDVEDSESSEDSLDYSLSM